MTSTSFVTSSNFVPVVNTQMNNDILDQRAFEQAIKNGDVNKIKGLFEGLFSPEFSVNQPFKSGELPVHLAVRCNQPDVVTELLKIGANPSQKDFQKLTAIDHAMFLNDEKMVMTIISYHVNKDLSEVQNQLQTAEVLHDAEILADKIINISHVNVLNISPLCKAAYLGDIKSLTELLSKGTLANTSDPNGMTPLHYAALGGQVEILDYFATNGGNMKVVMNDGSSLLHFAALSKSKESIEKLISYGLSPNVRNFSNETPMHFAAALDNMFAIETLAKKGGNPTLLNYQNISPYSLIGIKAAQRDPMTLNRGQVFMFITSVLYWGSQFMPEDSDTGKFLKKTATWLFIGMSVVEFANMYGTFNKSWKKAIALITFFPLQFIPPINVFFQAWKTTHTIGAALSGLKNCWNNLGYRNWTVARNVVVHSVNSASSVGNLVTEAKTAYEAYKFAYGFYLQVMIEFSAQTGDGDSYHKYFEEWCKFTNFEHSNCEPYGSGFGTINIDFDAFRTKFAIKSDPERILSTELNDKIIEHACFIFKKDCDWNEFINKGLPYLKGERKKLSLQYHPDHCFAKNQLPKDECDKIIAKMNNAWETIENYAAKNNLKKK